MIPRHYADIALRAMDGKPLPVVAGLVMGVLHGAFRENPGCYAVAFPSKTGSVFSTIRVFAEEFDEINALQSQIEEHNAIIAYARFKSIKAIPENFDGEWVSFTRFRIPGRKADRHEGSPLRLRRMRQADDENMPFLMLRSKSQKTEFGMRFRIAKGSPCSECLPDSYGLSTSSKVFSLPVV